MKHLLSSITLLLLSTLAFGQVPNTFSSGETISSSKINANFSFLANAMGSGNVTAMMMCTNLGYIDTDNPEIQNYGVFTKPNVIFFNCWATDNTSFSSTHNVCYASTWPPDDCNPATNQKYPHITWQQTIDQKWFLNKIDRTTNSTQKYNALYYFYKLSSD